MSAPGPYGYQPLWGIARAEGRSIRSIGRDVDGTSENYFHYVVRGWVLPSRQLAERVAEFVGRPVEDLFTPEAIAAMLPDCYQRTPEARATWKAARDRNTELREARRKSVGEER